MAAEQPTKVVLDTRHPARALVSDADALADAVLDSGHTVTAEGLRVVTWSDRQFDGRLLQIVGDGTGQKWLRTGYSDGPGLGMDPWADQGRYADQSLINAPNVAQLAGSLCREGVGRLLAVIQNRASAVSVSERRYDRIVGQSVFEFTEPIGRPSGVLAQIAVSTVAYELNFTIEAGKAGTRPVLRLPSNLGELPKHLSGKGRELARTAWLLHAASSNEAGDSNVLIQVTEARRERHPDRDTLQKSQAVNAEKELALTLGRSELEPFCQLGEEVTSLYVETGSQIVGLLARPDGYTYVEVVDIAKPDNRFTIVFNPRQQIMHFREFRDGIHTQLTGSGAIRGWRQFTNLLNDGIESNTLRQAAHHNLFRLSPLKPKEES